MAKKENIYGPVKAFSYLTGSASQDGAPSGVLRREEGLYGSREDLTRPSRPGGTQYASQGTHLNPYAPDRETGQTDYYMDQRSGSGYAGFSPPSDAGSDRGYNPQGQHDNYTAKAGYSNSGYVDSPSSSRRQGPSAGSRDKREKERHPRSPESHPTLFDNFILKGPGRDSEYREEPRHEPPPAAGGGGGDGSGGGRVPVQNLFDHNAQPNRQRKDDRNTKYSSGASSTANLIQDRSSSSASESGGRAHREPFRVRTGPASDLGISVEHEPPYNYGRKLPRIEASNQSTSAFSFGENPQAETRLHHKPHVQDFGPQQKQKNSHRDYFPQIQAQHKAPGSPKFRPTTQEDEFNTMMRKSSYDDNGDGRSSSGKRSFVCMAVTVTIVVALICLGVGFVAGWFGYMLAHQDEAVANSTDAATAVITSTTPAAVTAPGQVTTTPSVVAMVTTADSDEYTTPDTNSTTV